MDMLKHRLNVGDVGAAGWGRRSVPQSAEPKAHGMAGARSAPAVPARRRALCIAQESRRANTLTA